MLGAIIGDIVGSCYEFNGIKTKDFELFSPRSRYTDDSVMTMAVAEWLLEDPYHTHNILEEKMVKYGHLNTNVGYGSHFLHWLYFPQAKYEAKAKEYLTEKNASSITSSLAFANNWIATRAILSSSTKSTLTQK